MFNPELEVPSLELCKQLKNLGFSQEGGGYYWCKWHNNEPFRVIFSPNGKIFCEWIDDKYIEHQTPLEKYKAPTCRELGEWLPVRWRESTLVFENDTEPDARAKMLIWLAKNLAKERNEADKTDNDKNL